MRDLPDKEIFVGELPVYPYQDPRQETAWSLLSREYPQGGGENRARYLARLLFLMILRQYIADPTLLDQVTRIMSDMLAFRNQYSAEVVGETLLRTVEAAWQRVQLESNNPALLALLPSLAQSKLHRSTGTVPSEKSELVSPTVARERRFAGKNLPVQRELEALLLGQVPQGDMSFSRSQAGMSMPVGSLPTAAPLPGMTGGFPGLPGLPQAQPTTLPGLPQQQFYQAPLPGLPQALPQALPGLPAAQPTALPGLPQQSQIYGSALPGLPQAQPTALPGLPGGFQLTASPSRFAQPLGGGLPGLPGAVTQALPGLPASTAVVSPSRGAGRTTAITSPAFRAGGPLPGPLGATPAQQGPLPILNMAAPSTYQLPGMQPQAAPNLGGPTIIPAGKLGFGPLTASLPMAAAVAPTPTALPAALPSALPSAVSLPASLPMAQPGNIMSLPPAQPGSIMSLPPAQPVGGSALATMPQQFTAALPSSLPAAALPATLPMSLPQAQPQQALPTALPQAQPQQAFPTALPMALPQAQPQQAFPTALPSALPMALPQAQPLQGYAQPGTVQLQAQPRAPTAGVNLSLFSTWMTQGAALDDAASGSESGSESEGDEDEDEDEDEDDEDEDEDED